MSNRSSASQLAGKRLSDSSYSSSASVWTLLSNDEDQWTFWPSNEQVHVPLDKRTHTRVLPLPTTVEISIGRDHFHQVVYAGHGNSKVVYRLSFDRVLKLSPGNLQKNQEPDLFDSRHDLGVYPTVYASGEITQLNQARGNVKTWQTWITDYAKPLDQIIKETSAASYICITGAIRAMLRANTVGHILSDNALFNFGMVQKNILIIDAGSRFDQAKLTRGEFNKKVMQQFWRKVEPLVSTHDLTSLKHQWHAAGHLIDDAQQTYDNLWQDLAHDNLWQDMERFTVNGASQPVQSGVDGASQPVASGRRSLAPTAPGLRNASKYGCADSILNDMKAWYEEHLDDEPVTAIWKHLHKLLCKKVAVSSGIDDGLPDMLMVASQELVAMHVQEVIDRRQEFLRQNRLPLPSMTMNESQQEAFLAEVQAEYHDSLDQESRECQGRWKHYQGGPQRWNHECQQRWILECQRRAGTTPMFHLLSFCGRWDPKFLEQLIQDADSRMIFDADLKLHFKS
jgi:hypothetical protein